MGKIENKFLMIRPEFFSQKGNNLKTDIFMYESVWAHKKYFVRGIFSRFHSDTRNTQ